MCVCVFHLCCVSSRGRRLFCENVLGQRGWRNHLVGRDTLQTRLPMQKCWVVFTRSLPLQRQNWTNESFFKGTLMFTRALKYFKSTAICSAIPFHMLAYKQRKGYRKTQGGCVRGRQQFHLLILGHVSTCFTSADSFIIFSSPSSDSLHVDLFLKQKILHYLR